MPEIAPATSLLPTAPAQPVGTAAVSPAASGAPLATDPSGQAFLGQLKAALKTLASVVGSAPQVLQQGALTTSTATEQGPVVADKPSIPKASDAPSDAVSEILASLGFVPVPALHTPLPVADPHPAASGAAAAPDTSRGALGTTLMDTAANLQSAAGPAPTQTSTAAVEAVTAPTDPQTATQLALASAPEPAPVTLKAQLPPQAPALPNAGGALDGVAQSVVGAPRAATTDKASADPTTQGPIASPSTMAPQLRQPEANAPMSTQTTTLTATVQPQVQNGGRGAFHQEGESSDARHQHTSTGAATLETPAATPTASAVDQAVSAAVASPSAPAAPESVHAGEVVSQIAHQADLYRLPGNKGVRINLHPDDLGGVQVTLRYAAGGSLELHINAEHAATGALVQSGWTQLRDALATQGISPDRLVMSVSGPTGSSQLDFSSNSSGGSGYRSDSSLAAFTQGGQSGQHRDSGAGDEPRTSRSWNSTFESGPSADDTPRANSVAATSRIDYRV